MPTLVATDYNRKPRPFVDVRVRYVCGTCKEHPEGKMRALLDTGASMAAVMTADLLPPHVDYNQLPILGGNVVYPLIPRMETVEHRVWRCELRVFDVPIGTEIWVTPATSAPAPHLVLGTGPNGIFRHFDIGFAFSVDPPLIHLEPVRRKLGVKGRLPAFDDRPVADWGGEDGDRYVTLPDGSPIPRLAAPAVALLSAPERPAATRPAVNVAIRPRKRRKR